MVLDQFLDLNNRLIAKRVTLCKIVQTFMIVTVLTKVVGRTSEFYL